MEERWNKFQNQLKEAATEILWVRDKNQKMDFRKNNKTLFNEEIYDQ